MSDAPATPTDVHQHLWPPELVAALRERTRPPRLRGWTLQLDGEPDYAVDPDDHDPAIRASRNRADGIDRALVSLSAPIGIESLPAAEAVPLLAAWHDGAARLTGTTTGFGAWAAAGLGDPDPDELARRLDAGFVGLQLPATALLDAAGHERAAGLLDVLERADEPLMIHPGPARAPAGAPGWWPALVDYVAQMHAAWFAWAVHGRPRHPRLRVVFTLLAGLAPLHGERAGARGAPTGPPDPGVFYETSSYGPEAIGAVARVVGAGALVHGSDRPYAGPRPSGLDDVTLRTVNATRLLGSHIP